MYVSRLYVGAGKFFEQRKTSVGRCVIETDKLKITFCLSENRADRIIEKLFGIVDRHNDADGGAFVGYMIIHSNVCDESGIVIHFIGSCRLVRLECLTDRRQPYKVIFLVSTDPL